jgi:hypothetical protein
MLVNGRRSSLQYAEMRAAGPVEFFIISPAAPGGFPIQMRPAESTLAETALDRGQYTAYRMSITIIHFVITHLTMGE